MKNIISVLFIVIFAITFSDTEARGNKPCSAKKGGISHCQGAIFVCNDGSVSQSKKNCSREHGGDSAGSTGSSLGFAAVGGQQGCSCRSGNYCTGPRGGKYCLTDSGNKSYLRK